MKYPWSSRISASLATMLFFWEAGRVQLVDVDGLRVGGFLPRKSTVVDGEGWVGFRHDWCRRTLWTVPKLVGGLPNRKGLYSE